jgi:cation transport regulator
VHIIKLKFIFTNIFLNYLLLNHNMTKDIKKKNGGKNGRIEDEGLSESTEKRIDQLPEHAQHIFKKAHASAVKEYQDPDKRRGGKGESAEEGAHKVAWAAVKKEYKKEGDKWVKKDE